VKFFRSVLSQSAEELGANGLSVLGTSDITQRKHVREWIGDIIVFKALEIVPISKFAGRSAPTLLMSDVAKPEAIAEEVKALAAVPAEHELAPEAMPEMPKQQEVVAVKHVEPIKTEEEEDGGSSSSDDDDEEEGEGEEK
jgi:hypothetical protein